MNFTALLLLAIAAWAAADADPFETLMRVRDKVLARTQIIPNRTCVESIARNWYDYTGGAPPRSCDALLGRRKRAGAEALTQLATTDRLRVDVALADSREIYSWPGAAKFDDREIDAFVPPGAIGTGAFAATLLDIFEMHDPGFIFEGRSVLNGRILMEYSFSVTEAQSHYKAKAGKEWVIVGYTGTLLVDPATADLVRLNVRTEELPAATGACEVDRTLDYGAVRLSGRDYLLPVVSRERFITRYGAEAENTITFSACREFSGESSVSFDEKPSLGERQASGRGSPPVAPSDPFALPAGLPVTIELTSDVVADKAAAGDRIQGRLAAPIRDARKTQIFAPQGAAVAGRLMRVETRYGLPKEVTIALRWDTLDVNGVKTPIAIIPAWEKLSRKSERPAHPGQQVKVFDLPMRGEDRYGTFYFYGENVVMASGQLSKWLTSKP
jgi:hypothetical protein